MNRPARWECLFGPNGHDDCPARHDFSYPRSSRQGQISKAPILTKPNSPARFSADAGNRAHLYSTEPSPETARSPWAGRLATARCVLPIRNGDGCRWAGRPVVDKDAARVRRHVCAGGSGLSIGPSPPWTAFEYRNWTGRYWKLAYPRTASSADFDTLRGLIGYSRAPCRRRIGWMRWSTQSPRANPIGRARGLEASIRA